MPKNLHDYYYSFTSPPVQEPSSSSNIPRPSAPPSPESALPPYEDAFESSSSANHQYVPPNKSYLEGYVLDSDPLPQTLYARYTDNDPMPQPEHYSSDYNPSDQNIQPNAPLLGEEPHNNFAGRPPPPGYSLYKAKYKTVDAGVISRDEHINEDGEALLQFLYQQNSPPRMSIQFYGYHEETYWTTQSTRNSDGELVHEQVARTRRIDDFRFEFDCSAEISPVCQGVYVLPNPKTGEQETLRKLCDTYVHSKNKLKELKLTKEVLWDYNGLTRALTTAIRNSGFYENVEIAFKMEGHEIVVKSNSKISRYLDHTVTKILMFITCTWILILPIVWLAKAKIGHSRLKSAWNMKLSEKDWYNAHVREVIDACRGKNLIGKGYFRVSPPEIHVET